MNFIGKGETLKLLENSLLNARVLPQLTFTNNEWHFAKQNWHEVIRESAWMLGKVIVRSCASDEDQKVGSLAGKYHSVLNVSGISQIQKAIKLVLDSYGESRDDDKVFIQPMLTDIDISGVVFSQEPNFNSPYFVINYDDFSRKSDTITSGMCQQSKLAYIARSFSTRARGWKAKVVALMYELEILFNTNQLDIEFAITSRGDLYLFQVRPLVIECRRSFWMIRLSLSKSCNPSRASLLCLIYPCFYWV